MMSMTIIKNVIKSLKSIKGKEKTMSIKFIIILVSSIILIIILKYIEPMISKHKIKNSNEYGSARFSTIKEI